MTTTVIVATMLIARSVSMLVTYHSGDDCDDGDDEDCSCHVCFFRLLLFLMSVLYQVYRQLSRPIKSLSGIIPD